MAGIYLHIPFCKQACTYCNFHFSTSLKYKEEMLEAMLKELDLQKDYLDGAVLDSIYFGGGTPSLLEQAELELLFSKIYEHFEVNPGAEITLEANPDDINRDRLQQWRGTPINRLSIGIQSFADKDLQFMNRAHNAKEAGQCIDLALAAGFEKLTVDLIYGTPGMSDQQWGDNIQKVVDYGVPHISSYCLTVEPKTALDHFVKTGKAAPVDDEQAERQFLYLIGTLNQAGYDHYEISNFGLPGNYAQHNSNYWLGVPYLGIGPSAHSFNGDSRQWNIANNAHYIKRLTGATPESWYEVEVLDASQRYNEYVMTRLRTIWGVDLADLSNRFQQHFLKHIQAYLDSGHVDKEGNQYRLNPKGRLLADRIAMDVFY